MTTPSVIVDERVSQYAAEVALAEDDDVVEAVASERADDTFDVRGLPGAPRCDLHLPDAHASDTVVKGLPVDSVAIAEQVPRRGVPRECLGDLLSCPLCCRVLGHVEVHDPPSVMGEHDEDEHDPDRDRRHDEKSTETRSFTWLSRKARQVGDGVLRARTMYFSTVDLATSMPSLASSPAMRGDPQAGLAVDILRIRARTSSATAGRPGRRRPLRRAQWSRNRRRCHRMTVAGWTKTSADRQPSQQRESQDQKIRSALVVCARRGWRW